MNGAVKAPAFVCAGELAGVNLFKFVFSFFVIFIHCHPDNDVCFVIANGIGRLAVPYFFAVAGFMLRRRLKSGEKDGVPYRKTLLQYLRRLLKMYTVWSAIYLPFTLAEYIVGNGWDWKRCISEYVRAFFVTGTFTQLWYLPALITAAALVALACRKMKPIGVFLVGVLLYVVGVFDESYSGLCPSFLRQFYALYNPIFERTRAGLFFGVVFVALGFVIAERAEKEKLRLRVAHDAIGTAVFTALACVESFLLYKNGISGQIRGGVFEERFGMYLLLLPAVWFCVRLSLGIAPKFGEETAKVLRKLSTLLYLDHQFFNDFLIVLVADFLIGWEITDTLGGFFIVAATSLVASLLLMRLRNGARTKKLYARLT